MNTADAIISRLPKCDILTPRDIQLAAGLKTDTPITTAIAAGRLNATRIGHRYQIGREAAIAYIKACTVESDK